MRRLSKEDNRKPFINRQIIDIKSKRNENDKFKNMDYGDENGIWSRFIGLMKNSFNISLLNKTNNTSKNLCDINNKVVNTNNNHIKEILLKKSIEKNMDKEKRNVVREFKEMNIIDKRPNEKKSLSPKNSKLIAKPTSSISNFSSSLSSSSNNIGISFAEQILSYNSKDYTKVITGIVPTTPTTFDESSTTTSPAFTNIQFPSPPTNNSSVKLMDTPKSKNSISIESISSSPLKEEYYLNRKNHAVDFSADDNLHNIMDIIEGRVNENKEKGTNLDISFIKQFNSEEIFLDNYYEEAKSSSNKTSLLEKDLNGHLKNSSTISFSPLSSKNDRVCYSWREAKYLIGKLKSSTKVYKFNGVPFSEWIHEKIPTLGASPTSCRVQEMFRSKVITNKDEESSSTILFIKRIPRSIWSKQWEMHEIWDGDYVTDGEDFVMEAAALAFLQNHSEGIAPKLHAILEHKDDSFKENKVKNKYVNNRNACEYLLSKDTTHIILVSEYYGEDLLDYLDKCEKQNKILTEKQKKDLQYNLALVLNKLHLKGLSHLDFTPENILIGSNGINICDFAKSTPIITKNPRHSHYKKKLAVNNISENYNANNNGFNIINPPPDAYYEFESCEPTVGKGAYMPPECWKIFWKLEENKIQFPLEELMECDSSHYNVNNLSKKCNKNLIESNDKSSFYFNVRVADIYMLGIIMFWIWSDGGIWKYSDTRQDHRYQNLVFSDLNLDIFRECRNWNKSLKSLLRKMLEPDPKKRITMNEILNDPWWRCRVD